jgi:hypothetical protein
MFVGIKLILLYTELMQFYHNILNGLKDVMWKAESGIIEGDEMKLRSSP